MSAMGIHRLGSASSSINKSYDEEQNPVQFQRSSKRHISQVTKQKIEEFKSLTEQFLSGQRVPELSDLQKALIKKQQIDSIRDAGDLRKMIIYQKNEKQRTQIQQYENKYKKQQEKHMMEKLERKIEVDERTKQRSNEFQKKIEQKMFNNEERLKQEQNDKDAKNKLQGIKDIFFKQFIQETEQKAPSPQNTSDIDQDENLEKEDFIDIEYFTKELQKERDDNKDESRWSNDKKSVLKNEKSKYSKQAKMKKGQNISQEDIEKKKLLSVPIENLVSQEFKKNNEKLMSQYYHLNRFQQFQKDIEKKLRLEQERLYNEQRMRQEIEAQTNNFVLTKEMWENVIEADKNNQPFHLPNFGIEKTPVYKMQQNDEEEKRKKIERKQRIKQGVFVVPKKPSTVNFQSIYKGVKHMQTYSTLFKTAQYTDNNLLESSLNNSVKQARLVWGQNFLKPTFSQSGQLSHQQNNNTMQRYNYSIEEEDQDKLTEPKDQKQSEQQFLHTENSSNKNQNKSVIEKDSILSKSQSAYYQQRDNDQYKESKQIFFDARELYNTAASTHQSNKLFKTTSKSNFTSSQKNFVYTNSHQKIKLY